MPTNEGRVDEIFSDLIDFPEDQMRRDIDRDELHQLAASIKEKGLISPITVRPVGERYELVAGQRRLLACNIAGIIRIPCIVRDLDKAQALDIMATENLERVDVDVVDEASFLKTMMDATGESVTDLARRLKRSAAYIESRLVVGAMPEYMRTHLKLGELKLGVALALFKIEPDEKRHLWVGLAIEQNITVRTAEYWAYQHELGTLPDVRPADGDTMDGPGAATPVIMSRCAIDGTEYPMKLTKMVTIAEANMPIFVELARAVREERAQAQPASA